MIKQIVLFLFMVSMFLPNTMAQGGVNRYENTTIIGRGIIGDVELSPDNTQIAVTTDLGLRIYTSQLQDVYFESFPTPIVSLTWSNDNEMVVTGEQSGNINIFTAVDYSLRYNFQMLEGDYPNILSFSSDGKFLVGGTSTGNIYIWELATGIVEKIIPAHQDIITSISWDPSGNYIISSGLDNRLVFLDTHNFEIIREIENQFARQISWHPSEPQILVVYNTKFEIFDVQEEKSLSLVTFDNPIYSVNWNNNGASVAGIEENSNRVWDIDLTSGNITTVFTYDDYLHIKEVALSNNLLVANSNGMLVIIDMLTDSILYQIEEYYTEIIDIDWSKQDENIVATTHKGGRFLVWNIGLNEVIFSYQTDFDNPIVEWGKQYIALADDEVYILDPDDYTVIYSLAELKAPISWNNNGNLLVAKSDNKNGLAIFDTTKNQIGNLFAEQCEIVSDIAWSNISNQIALDCGILYLYRASDGELLWESDNVTNAVLWTDDDMSILTFSTHSQLIEPTIRNSINGEIISAIEFQTNIAWQPSGEYFVGALSEGNTSFLLIQNKATLEVIDRLDNHSDYILDISWNAEGTRFASVDSNQIIKIWE